MLSQLTIAKDKTSEPAIDQQQLYAIGLKHVQELASRIWTDFNVHDPGITILELLCYALTDLSYRAQFPVSDILASECANAENMEKQFFTARRILPNRPLTLPDYRKLLIDLKGVKNAWLRPASLTYYADTVIGKLMRESPDIDGIREVNVSGLYDVIIEYMDDATASEKDEALKKVKERLHANRNLCEDFVSYNEIETQSFLLCCELELAPDADTAKVKAETLFKVQQYLAPPVFNYTLSEMMKRKKPDGSVYTSDEIFEGPLLDCGFIDDEELARADLRTEIRLSDVISIIMDIEGVRAVRDIVVNPEGTSTPLINKWVIPVVHGKKAALNIDRSPLVFYKGNMPVEARQKETDEYLKKFREEQRSKLETASEYDLEIPLGKFRQMDSYYSFQNHFPALYGLSESGISSTADDRRKAQAFQLKSYLLFFDQVMANYHTQLSRVKDLFSTDPDIRHTYYSQVVKSFTKYEEIYKKNTNGDIINNLVETDAGETFSVRRNRFLDHLIARFAERFNDFAHIMYSAFGSNPASMVTYKCAFLNNYPAISSERSLAYNYTLNSDNNLWNTENVSGLEKRLSYLLGIHNFKRRNLGDIAYDVYTEVDTTPGDEYRFRVRKRDTGKIILSSSTRYTTPEMAKAEMRRAIQAGLIPSGYKLGTTSDSKYYFNVIDETGEVIARRIEYFDTEAKRDNAIDEVMEYLRVNYSDEGMYLIENILLRPDYNDDPFLPICPATENTAPTEEDSEEDPYSYRINIILPAYGHRFSNMDFRRFAEDVIRSETPAHILPKICWISKDDMAGFEKLYRDWIYLKPGAETAQRKEKLTAFIDKLYAVKNVYPPRQLHECGTGEEKPKFIIGQSSLGTMEE